MPTVHLKPGHVQPVWAGHPWVYAQAVATIEGGAVPGDEVDVADARGNFLGRGFYSPGSAIPVRVVSRDPKVKIDAGFFHARVARALSARAMFHLPSSDTNGHRLVHAEGDGMPGLIVDRYGDVLAVQFLTIGMKLREHLVLEALSIECKPRAIVDRTPAFPAKAEGFVPSSGVVRGADIDALEFRERGLAYRIPLDTAQKTGFFFDQRVLRARIEQLAHGKRVLDAYSYVGAFAMAAARGGASEVRAIDESAPALEIGAECARMNGLGERITWERGDARRVLAQAGSIYDIVVVDPPRLAPSRAARENALVAYTRLAELGCRATRPGGILVFCSCSAAVDLTALTRALATGALRANVQALTIERHFQGVDHPVSAAFPEGLYLKALVARIEPR